MNNRDSNYKKQLKFSFLYKFLSIIFSFLFIRYSLSFLGVEYYGLWSVILTFVNWLVFFDLGISNGVKNNIAKNLSNNKIKEVQEFITTGYGILTVFVIVIYVILFIVSFFVNWQIVFNYKLLSNDYLQTVILIVTFFILLNFVLAVITAILNAKQQSSLVVLNQFFTQFFALLFVLGLNLFTKSSILFLAVGYGLSLVISNLLISVIFFKNNFNLFPKLYYFRKNKIKSILSLGVKFFIIQLTYLVIMTSDRMITLQLLDPRNATYYDLLNKYFSVLLIVHSLINSPLWPMYTEAYEKKDFKWIKKILKKLNLFLVAYVIILIVLSFLGKHILYIWTGNNTLNINLSSYFFMGGMIFCLIWSSIYAYFLNGLEKLNIQLIGTVIGAVINIPLSIIFVKYFNLGLNGIILATIVSMLVFNILGTIQTYNIIKKWE